MNKKLWEPSKTLKLNSNLLKFETEYDCCLCLQQRILYVCIWGQGEIITLTRRGLSVKEWVYFGRDRV